MGVGTTILCKLQKVIAHICNLYVVRLRTVLDPVIFVCSHLHFLHVIVDHTPGVVHIDGITDPSF